ncbi:hypothetical protein ACQPW1_11990 [Nocardia sp. CA-128927]|uniref:hypothetical protein n=1 Tax=Nocardia sp. CA-128927 TaxID=3239975 RepID=UPI003D98D42F
MTSVIRVPEGAFGDARVSDDLNAFDDNDLENDVSERDVSDDDETVEEESVSPMLRRRRRVTEFATAGDVRRRVPYAVAVVVVLVGVIGVVVATSI